MKFGDWLTLQMSLAGLSPQDISKKTGVCEATVRNWETNEHYPELLNLIALCEVLAIELDRNPSQLLFELVTQLDEFKYAMERWKKRK